MTLTIQDLDNAKLDTQTISDVANGAVDFGGDGLVHPRLGGNIKTLAKAIDDLNGNTIPVIATGSITSRILADRFADVKNIKDFGAVGDGVTDDTTALSLASASALASNAFLFSNGDHLISSPVPNMGKVPRIGNGKIIQDGFVYPFSTFINPIDERKRFYSSTFSGSIINELQAEGGDYHAFPMITQNRNGVILASWMHQTQHTGGANADVVCKISNDGGANWSNLQIIYGTLNGGGSINPFYQITGIDAKNRFVCIFNKYASNPSVAPSQPWITRSYDGFNWSTPVKLTFTGDSIGASNTIIPFGEIKTLPSGKMSLAIYQGTPTDSHYIGVIDDDVSDSNIELRLIASIGDYTASTISFTAPNTISDSANGLGFLNLGERFNTDSVSGTNDRAYTVTGTGAGSITVSQTVTDESAATAGDVTILLDYNEMVFIPATETIWFAFLRQAGVTNEVPYYVSQDAGATWTWQGHIGCGLAGGWIPQAGERVTVNNEPHILLALGLRDSSTTPSQYNPSSIQYFICPIKEAISNSGKWVHIHEMQLTNDAFTRDVYTSQIIDDVSGEILSIAHEETATDESRIVLHRFNYRELASNEIDYVDITLEGTGGSANTYSGNPRMYYVKNGHVVNIYGDIVLSAINTTGPLTIEGLPFTVKSNSNIINCYAYNTVAPAENVTLRGVAGENKFQILEGWANSNLDSSEVNANFNLRFCGLYFTDD